MNEKIAIEFPIEYRPAPANEKEGVWFQSKVSGLRYRDPRAAGDIGAVIIDGVMFHLISIEVFSTEAIVAELKKRRAQCDDPRPVRRWCDECTHFPKTSPETPPTVHTCDKGHIMAFRLPPDADPHSNQWGFYRRRCRDYDHKENR